MADPLTDAQAHAVAGARIERALQLIEEAQRQLGRAAQELSPIVGLAPMCAATSKLYDRVHAHWYRVKTKLDAGRFTLDDGARLYYGPDGEARHG